VADIPAGSLTVKVDANIKPLEDGLNKAKQKVGQADKAIEQTTEKTKKGFFEAGGKVKDFQSKLSESLGVIAGFAAAAQLIGGIADGFTAASEAIEESNGGLDALDKGTAAFLEKVPILNNFANFGRSLAIGLGLAVDEAKELQEAMESVAREQQLFAAAVSGMDQSLANQAAIAELQGNTLEANKLKAEAAFQAQMRQAQELRDEAKKFAQEEGTSVTEGRAGVASRQAAELEAQAKQIRDLTIQAAERAEQEAKIAAEQAKAKEEAAEALRIQQEQQRLEDARVQKQEQLAQAALASEEAQKERLELARLQLQIAEATDEKRKEELQNFLELVKAENAFEESVERVNKLFDQRVELAKQGEESEADVARLERERQAAIDRVKQEFEAKEQQRAIENLRKRKEQAVSLAQKQADDAKKIAEAAAKEQAEAEKAEREKARLTTAGETAIGAFKFALSGLTKGDAAEKKADQEAPKQTELLQDAVNLLDRIARAGASGALT